LRSAGKRSSALAAFERLRSEKARPAAAVPAGPPNVTKQAIDPIRRQ
jgi:hypothetical protein